jgi:hypothetical protein
VALAQRTLRQRSGTRLVQVPTDHEEGGVQLPLAQLIEHLLSDAWRRTVVKREGYPWVHFVVSGLLGFRLAPQFCMFAQPGDYSKVC